MSPNAISLVKKLLLSFVGIAWLGAPLLAADAKVRLEQKGDTIQVTLNGEELAVYHTSKKYPKPFFSPVRSEGGTIVTRALEDAKDKDHPHHKGVWLAVDEVNGVDFWAEKGRIENVKLELLAAEGSPAKMRVTNHWLEPNGKPAVIETTEIAIHGNRLFAYDIRFEPGGETAEFHDTKEGLFGIRFPLSATEKRGDGKIVNADGMKGSAACWGKPSKWIDYYGTIEGKIHGAAIFDHPENPRPSRYHVRDYGLFTISPFGERAYTNGKSQAQVVHLKKGESYRLRYGLFVHPGDTQAAKVAAVYESWLKDGR
jgi:VCBS repeat-containing protein